jgi:ABC-2 type transport system permease protein
MTDPHVWLVAEREVRERARTRAFRLGTVAAALVVVVLVAVPAVAERSEPRTAVVLAVGAVDDAVRAGIESLGPSLGDRVRVEVVDDAGAARARLGRDEAVVVIEDGGQRLVIDRPLAGDASTRDRLVTAVADVLRVQRALLDAGVGAEVRSATLAAPLPEVVALRQPALDPTTRRAALVGMIGLLLLLQTYASWVVGGVVADKQTGVVELLLGVVRPRALLAGKVLGVGLVAVAQVSVLVTVGLVTANLSGSSLLAGAAPGALTGIAGWLLLGYAFSCSLFAAAGSLCSRLEDVQGVIVPLLVPVVVGAAVAVPVLLTSSQPSPLLRVLAFVPPTAPFCMPVVQAAGLAPWWHVVLAVAGVVVTGVAVWRVAEGVYARSLLHQGTRRRWRDALRAA